MHHDLLQEDFVCDTNSLDVQLKRCVFYFLQARPSEEPKVCDTLFNHILVLFFHTTFITSSIRLSGIRVSHTTL